MYEKKYISCLKKLGRKKDKKQQQKQQQQQQQHQDNQSNIVDAFILQGDQSVRLSKANPVNFNEAYYYSFRSP